VTHLSPALDGVTLALLEGQFMSGEIGRPSFVDRVMAVVRNNCPRPNSLADDRSELVAGHVGAVEWLP